MTILQTRKWNQNQVAQAENWVSLDLVRPRSHESEWLAGHQEGWRPVGPL